MDDLRFEHDSPMNVEDFLRSIEMTRDPKPDGAEWQRQYGFPHDCTCGDDMNEGNTQTVPECYIAMTERAMEKLVELRGVLYVIANSEATDAYALKALAHQAFFDTAA